MLKKGILRRLILKTFGFCLRGSADLHKSLTFIVLGSLVVVAETPEKDVVGVGFACLIRP